MLNQWFLIQHLKEFIEVLVKENASELCHHGQPLFNKANNRKRKGRWSLEFVLMNMNTESENRSIAEENVALQGVFEVTTSSREAEIFQAIGNATREKYSMISDHDLIKGSCWNQFLAKHLITNCGDFQEPLAGFETLVFLGKNLQWWNSNFWQPLWE